MVILSRIYTRTGDAGKTRLGGGAEVAKTDVRVEAYGAVDELNSVIGLACTAAGSRSTGHLEILRWVQNDLFDLGADLCRPLESGETPSSALRMQASQVARLEGRSMKSTPRCRPWTALCCPAGPRHRHGFTSPGRSAAAPSAAPGCWRRELPSTSTASYT